jgi:hypothetical protein
MRRRPYLLIACVLIPVVTWAILQLGANPVLVALLSMFGALVSIPLLLFSAYKRTTRGND